MVNLREKRIIVTGGKGFLGKHIVQRLNKIGDPKKMFVADLPEYDLRDIQHIKRMYEDFEPDIVIHLAGVVGGIEASRNYPGTFFYDNAIMGIQLLHQGHLNKTEKIVILGTVCSYPKYTPVPFKEEDLWNGYPEDSNAPYGLAKKILLVQSQAYRQQYDLNSIYLLLVNLYGPGDNFDPRTSHVIPALIRKFVEAIGGKEEATWRMKKRKRPIHLDAPVHVWGTGQASREFLYVEDAAEAIVMATYKYDKKEPINIGAGYEIKIKDLVTLIGKILYFKGEIIWEPSKPDGQPRRMLDTIKAEREIGFCAKTSLEEGLRKTISWYITSSSSY